MEDVQAGEEQRLGVGRCTLTLPTRLYQMKLLITFISDHHVFRSPSCPEVSRSCECSCTAQEVRVISLSFLQDQLLTSQPSHGVWIRAHEECVSVDLNIHASSLIRHCTATVPTPEQTYDALAPDLKKKVDAARATRLARENMTGELQTKASRL